MNHLFKTIFILMLSIVSICSIQGNPINAMNDPRRHQMASIDSTKDTINSINVENKKLTENDKNVLIIATGVILVVVAVVLISIYNSLNDMSFPMIGAEN